jgi:hypothetical protein
LLLLKLLLCVFSDGLPKGVQEELRQAVHLLLAQQDDMEKMRAVIERQSLVIDRLIQKRMVAGMPSTQSVLCNLVIPST